MQYYGHSNFNFYLRFRQASTITSIWTSTDIVVILAVIGHGIGSDWSHCCSNGSVVTMPVIGHIVVVTVVLLLCQ